MSQPEDASRMHPPSHGSSHMVLSESCPRDPRVHNSHVDQRRNVGMAAAACAEDMCSVAGGHDVRESLVQFLL
ncbi:hypothetical protein N7490_000135 [Penicillium lividum]|nr:hypothetical protein N7490_000135 [Penicillium lividum]